MRIDSIVLREVQIPLLRPFETSFGVTRERRILLAEVRSEGLTGWGECTAGERPFFSAESTDSAWQVIVNELGPVLAASEPEHGGECPGIFRQVRGNPMAKATLENAIWDLEAQREGLPLAQLIGGVRETIACGVSLGIQPSISELMAVIDKELAAGYQRIKLKCKPGWDVEVFDRVRNRWPEIMLSLSLIHIYDPEVYWGLAESERGLGQFAEARANYKKLLDYDPDGPHGKAARKALKDPEIANAQAAGVTASGQK